MVPRDTLPGVPFTSHVFVQHGNGHTEGESSVLLAGSEMIWRRLLDLSRALARGLQAREKETQIREGTNLRPCLAAPDIAHSLG